MENKLISDNDFNKNNLEQLIIKYRNANYGQSKLASHGMKYIPAGELILGSEKVIDNPKHKVSLANDFEIGEYLVTIKEFSRFCPEKINSGKKYEAITNISKKDAYNYCKWLSLNTEDIPYSYKEEVKKLPDISDYYFEYAWKNPQAKLFRLPSEAEWEYACRLDAIKIGRYRDSNLELINIWEWCMDQYGGVPLIKSDHFFHTDGAPKIDMLPDQWDSIRGIINDDHEETISARGSRCGDLKYDYIGIRIARSRP